MGTHTLYTIKFYRMHIIDLISDKTGKTRCILVPQRNFISTNLKFSSLSPSPSLHYKQACLLCYTTTILVNYYTFDQHLQGVEIMRLSVSTCLKLSHSMHMHRCMLMHQGYQTHACCTCTTLMFACVFFFPYKFVMQKSPPLWCQSMYIIRPVKILLCYSAVELTRWVGCLAQYNLSFQK